MKKQQMRFLSGSRSSPAILATTAGAAVCLSAVRSDAASGVGNIVESNVKSVTELSGKLRATNVSGNTLYLRPKSAAVTSAFVVKGGGGVLKTYDSGVSCKTKVSTATWNSFAYPGPGGASKYIKIRFKEGGVFKYGWSQFVRQEKNFLFGAWSYNEAGDPIKTLADCLTAARLPLTDGNVKLHWANLQEDGLAAYRLQKRNAAGAWEDVESFVPGDGTYSAIASGDGNFRILSEQVDGRTTTREF